MSVADGVAGDGGALPVPVSVGTRAGSVDVGAGGVALDASGELEGGCVAVEVGAGVAEVPGAVEVDDGGVDDVTAGGAGAGVRGAVVDSVGMSGRLPGSIVPISSSTRAR